MATVAVYSKKLYLQIDPCSRVIRNENFLETMNDERKNLSF